MNTLSWAYADENLVKKRDCWTLRDSAQFVSVQWTAQRRLSIFFTLTNLQFTNEVFSLKTDMEESQHVLHWGLQVFNLYSLPYFCCNQPPYLACIVIQTPCPPSPTFFVQPVSSWPRRSSNRGTAGLVKLGSGVAISFGHLLNDDICLVGWRHFPGCRKRASFMGGFFPEQLLTKLIDFDGRLRLSVMTPQKVPTSVKVKKKLRT